MTLAEIVKEWTRRKKYEFDLAATEEKCLELQKENAQLKGEEPIPFAWWSECPKLAQRTMEKIITENEKLQTKIDSLEAENKLLIERLNEHIIPPVLDQKEIKWNY